MQTRTHPDGQSGLVTSRQRWLLRTPFAQIDDATSARQTCCTHCSQGANVIPPNGSSGLEALSSTQPLVLLCRVCKISDALIDVVTDSLCTHDVDGQGARIPDSRSFQNRLLYGERHCERHSERHSETTFKPFTKTIAALSRTLRQQYFLCHVFGPCVIRRCGCLDGDNSSKDNSTHDAVAADDDEEEAEEDIFVVALVLILC